MIENSKRARGAACVVEKKRSSFLAKWNEPHVGECWIT
jgi:hypothetical protein